MLAIENELSRCGLRAIEVPTTASTPTGIGGAAKVLRTMLVPISPGGVPGVVQFVVIEGGVPPLLSVGLLEHLGASMDLVTNRIHFKAIDVEMKMTNLPTGHRAIQLVQWPGGPFPVPAATKEQDEAFAKQPVASSAYTKEECQPHTTDVSAALVLDTGQNTVESFEQSVRVLHELPVSALHVPAREHVPVHADVGGLSAPAGLRDPSSVTSGSIAPMGNVTLTSSKFENLSQHPDHGAPVSPDGGCGNQRRTTSCTTMAGDGPSDVLHPGVHPSELLPPGGGRAHTEKPCVRAEEVPHGSTPGAGQVLAFRSSGAESKPVCHVDGVLKVLSAAELPVPPGTSSQEQGQGSSCKLRDGGPAVLSTDYNASADLLDGQLRAGGPRLSRVGSHSSGLDAEFPGDGEIHEGVGPGTESNAADDAAQRRLQHADPANGPSGADGARGHAGGCGGAGAHKSGQPVISSVRSECQSQRQRPALRSWPAWIDYFGFVLDVIIAVGPDFGWDAGSAHFVRTAQHFIGYSFRGLECSLLGSASLGDILQ